MGERNYSRSNIQLTASPSPLVVLDNVKVWSLFSGYGSILMGVLAVSLV
jgi:hypothetical protein